MSKFQMLSIPDALQIVLQCTSKLEQELVDISSATGRILAEAILAKEPLPPFPASIKDGYAVVSSDPVSLERVVIGVSRPGTTEEFTVQPGTAAYITTGAPVPNGADAVVQIEDIETIEQVDGSKVIRVTKQPRPGLDIRAVGSDIREGDLVLDVGEKIGAAEVGILATVGVTQLAVYPQPRVAILSTGDEVMEPSTAVLGPGQIRDCNRAMLASAVAAMGGVPLDLGIARDNEGKLEGSFKRALELGADILITSGGVSMGDRDLIKPLLERLGTIHFGRVLMKPGKPLTFATIEAGTLGARKRMIIFGLPGNPVSSFVCFHLVVVPSMRKMTGWKDPNLRRIHVELTEDIKLDPERPEYHRAMIQYGRSPHSSQMCWYAVSTGNQISSRLLSARSANALLELPQRSGVLPAGTRVSALLVDDLRGMPVPGVVPITEALEHTQP